MNPFSITELAKHFITEHLQSGDRAIDATAGNGWDTLALAQTVGPTGQVTAFDIQADALTATRDLLEGHDGLAPVELIQACHSALADHCPEPVQAIMFNLGYLPHGDKNLTTTMDATLRALRQARERLSPEGLLSVVTYPGHEEGRLEHAAISRWIEDEIRAPVTHIEISNHRETAPHVFLLPAGK